MGGGGGNRVRRNRRRQPGRPRCREPPPELQNVMAVSPRHCSATSVLRNCCPNCCTEQSHRDNVRSAAPMLGSLKGRYVGSVA